MKEIISIFFKKCFSYVIWSVPIQGLTLPSDGIIGMQHSLGDFQERKAGTFSVGNSKVCSGRIDVSTIEKSYLHRKPEDVVRHIYRALASLHQQHFVHADLKPANIMWSSYDGRFKVLDFGLTFHTDEEDLHQIQSPGYKAPEVAEWNKYKDEMKKRRKRKLQGAYSDLTKAAPAYEKGLQNIGVQGSAPIVVQPISESPIPSGASRTILRAPPRRNRLSGVFSGSSDQGLLLLASNILGIILFFKLSL